MKYTNYFGDIYFCEKEKLVSLYFESPLLERMVDIFPELKMENTYSESYVTYDYISHKITDVDVKVTEIETNEEYFNERNFFKQFLKQLTEEELIELTEDAKKAFYESLKDELEYAKLQFRDKVKKLNEPLYYYLISNKFHPKFSITEHEFDVFGYDIYSFCVNCYGNSFGINYYGSKCNYILNFCDLVDTKEMTNYIQKDLYSEKSAFYEMGQAEGMVGAIDNVINETLSDGYELSFNELIIEAFKRTLENKEIIMLVFGYIYTLYLLEKIESEGN